MYCDQCNTEKDSNGLKSSTWTNSANFAKKLDTVIDLGNAYHLKYGESRKKPLSPKNSETLQVKKLNQNQNAAEDRRKFCHRK